MRAAYGWALVVAAALLAVAGIWNAAALDIGGRFLATAGVVLTLAALIAWSTWSGDIDG